MNQPILLDQYISRFQNVQPFNVYAITSNGDVEPWYEVTDSIVGELVLREEDLSTQVQSITAQIQFWGRLEAQSRRVWEVEERKYRQWRATQYLVSITPPVDDAKWKKPSEKAIEAMYRSHPEYEGLQVKIERAEEAYNATRAVLEGFRAKRDMLKSYVFRHHEDGAPRLAV